MLEENKTTRDAERWRKISAKRFINLQVIKSNSHSMDVINLSLSWQPDLEAFSVSFTSHKRTIRDLKQSATLALSRFLTTTWTV